MNILLQFKTNRFTALPIRPVFDHGLIIFARAYTDGTRTVTFEDPAIQYQPQTLTYFGKGKHVDIALSHALRQFHATSPSQTNAPEHTQSTRPSHVAALTEKLDIWLVKHKGLLRAVSEDDGTILVKLEGLADPDDVRSNTIMLEGSGSTFYSALAAALNEYRKHHPRYKQIAVSAE